MPLNSHNYIMILFFWRLIFMKRKIFCWISLGNTVVVGGSNTLPCVLFWCPEFLPFHCLVHLLMSGLWPWIISCNHHSFSRCWHSRQLYSLWEQLLLWEEGSWKHIPITAWLNWGSKHHGNNGCHWPISIMRRCTESQENQRGSAENKAKHMKQWEEEKGGRKPRNPDT